MIWFMDWVAPILLGIVGALATMATKRMLPKAEELSIQRKSSSEMESMSVETMRAVVEELREDMISVRMEVKELRDELKGVKAVFRISVHTIEKFIRWASRKGLDDYPRVPDEIVPYMSFHIDRRGSPLD